MEGLGASPQNLAHQTEPDTLTYGQRVERKALAPEGAGTGMVLARLPRDGSLASPVNIIN